MAYYFVLQNIVDIYFCILIKSIISINIIKFCLVLYVQNKHILSLESDTNN